MSYSATPESGVSDLTRAKRSAFQYLKTRNRSEREIRIQLSKKKFTLDTIEQTVLYLKNLKLIDDQQFARDWITMRLRKPLGLRRIFFELKEKGINEEILKSEINVFKETSNEEETAESLARKRILKYKNLAEPVGKRRVFEYLARRGFNPQTITKIIDKL